MANEVTYSFSGNGQQRSSDVAEMSRIVRQLVIPKTTLVTNPSSCKGYLDFFVLDDGQIEMEIFENDDDFATVDVETAVRVMEIAMIDTRELPLRQKLAGLPIDWLT
jgi:hypothetical protein